jgi:hypothetical protein
MKRLLTLVTLAFLVVTSSASASSLRHCPNYYKLPHSIAATNVLVTGMSCGDARHVVAAVAQIPWNELPNTELVENGRYEWQLNYQVPYRWEPLVYIGLHFNGRMVICKMWY